MKIFVYIIIIINGLWNKELLLLLFFNKNKNYNNTNSSLCQNLFLCSQTKTKNELNNMLLTPKDIVIR